MKKAAFALVLIYIIVLLALTYVLPVVSFLGTPTKVEPVKISKELGYWIWFAIFIISQIALLTIPVKVETNRPVARRAVILPIIAASLMTGLLAFGALFSINELLSGGDTPDAVKRAGWTAFGLVWLVWAYIFWRWSRKTQPRGLIEKMTRVLYTGSILELLIAVPTHIVARQRAYCCAGFATFIGISIGVSIMILAFGPAVFILYADRLRKKTSRLKYQGGKISNL